MPRARVDPSKRQRTAQACDSCKKRKQKCDGKHSCQTCIERGFGCSYTTNGRDHRQDPTKNKEDNPESASEPPAPTSQTEYSSRDVIISDESPSASSSTSLSSDTNSTRDTSDYSSDAVHSSFRTSESNMPADAETVAKKDVDGETDGYAMMRMLQDKNGRLTYYGDAANASFLQLVRNMVETAAGSSGFTLDPSRNEQSADRLDESIRSQLSHQLPNREVIRILSDSFFAYTCGICEIFDERQFLSQVLKYNKNPLSVDRTWLSQLFLVLASGLSFATPQKGSHEASVINKLLQINPKQSQAFYFTAQELYDPTQNPENHDMSSLQTLACMTLYLIVHMQRHRAFIYCGLAVRFAQSLGLHQEETLVIYNRDEQRARSRLWQTILIFDRLLSASLGRPTATIDENWHRERCFAVMTVKFETDGIKGLCSASLEATMGSCHIIGLILQQIYQQRNISTALARELADVCTQWNRTLPQALRWQEGAQYDIRKISAAFHTNLIYWHSIILLTRPLFLHLVSIEIQRAYLGNLPSERAKADGRNIVYFANACVTASNNTINLVCEAWRGGYLPAFNFFSTDHLFVASLVILTRNFTWISDDELSMQRINNAISVLEGCGKFSPEAMRDALVLRNYQHVVRNQVRRQTPRSASHEANLKKPPPSSTRESDGNLPTLTFGPPVLPQGPPLPADQIRARTSGAERPCGLNETLAPEKSFSTEESFEGLVNLEHSVLQWTPATDSFLPDETIDFQALWHNPTNDHNGMTA